MTAVRSCWDCRFAEVAAAPGGQVDFSKKVCKHSPPRAVFVPTDKGWVLDSAFPVVTKAIWCHSGEPIEGAAVPPGERPS